MIIFPKDDGNARDLVVERNEFFKGMPIMSHIVKALERLHNQTGEIFFAFHLNREEKQLFVQAKGDRIIYKVEVSRATPDEQMYWEQHGGFNEYQQEQFRKSLSEDQLGESGDDYEELADEDKDVIDRLLDKANTLVKKLKPGKLRDRLENAIDLLTVDEDVETDVEEKEDLLPDSVVNEAVEMLRRID